MLIVLNVTINVVVVRKVVMNVVIRTDNVIVNLTAHMEVKVVLVN